MRLRLLGLGLRSLLSGLGSLGSVLGARLLAVLHAGGVEAAADHVVAHARQVLHAAAADKHARVLLEVVAFAADVADDLVAIREAHLGDLAQRRIGLLRRRRVDARADSALLRAAAQRRHLALALHPLARFAQQLIDRRHLFSQPWVWGARGPE